MQPLAALTMVRDDPFFLRAWLRHYGEALGRENCYIINHGRGSAVEEAAQGCNIIGIPCDPHRNFDMKRWRLLNGLVEGLRAYYDYVIVGDVDELVVLDPACGKGLVDWVSEQPRKRVLTPLGMEVIHRIDLEPEAITDTILGPRMHVRPAPHYSKPAVVAAGVKIARGGHFTQYDKLHTPDDLYLLHLKYCDFETYCRTMNQRNAVTEEIGAKVRDTAIGRHWFTEARGEDRAVFEAFADLRMQDEFTPGPLRRKMHRTWQARKDTGFWQFDRPDYDIQFRLPERFAGVV